MLRNDTFLRAARGEPVPYTPVWYMRQAGRSDPEYRAIKEKYSLLEINQNSELAAYVTRLPVEKLGVDAAILYSDIMNPLAGLGVKFDIQKGVGPVVHHPIRSEADVLALSTFDLEPLASVLKTIALLKQSLTVPLIGFAGAPFTLASYLIEGGPSRTYRHTKQFMLRHPKSWNLLMERLSDMAARYLRAQIEAGASAVQLFDSWVGQLSPVDFRHYVLPYVERIFVALKDLSAVKIYFPGVASGELLPELKTLPVEVIGVDWRVPLDRARFRTDNKFVLQGNFDPLWLEAPRSAREAYARSILEEGLKGKGHIFNLGHGVYPEADIASLRALTEYVQTTSRALRAT
ncbi:MAG: Uroporphyrinogen III decarboxylase [Candidatus Carbobacillus altaicus]|uniref:Uroporphyrinogen decarboxylase n=1 Tax=Candidatus Carbonibacillus altaicus TaxID=2163959 RepID=A0A2R6Y438_9BACL|nr:MAG: Uroporphyrinogen III decarboxylase [Candidatus Carbobacillus altaicus]